MAVWFQLVVRCRGMVRTAESRWGLACSKMLFFLLLHVYISSLCSSLFLGQNKEKMYLNSTASGAFSSKLEVL